MALPLRRNTAAPVFTPSLMSVKYNHHRRHGLCSAARMLPSCLNEKKPKGSEGWSSPLQPTTTVDGDNNGYRTPFSGSCTTTKGNADDSQSSENKEFNNFIDNLQCLWKCQHGPLFDQILFKCMDYITPRSRIPRTYRQAATLRCLHLVTSFISVARRETTCRQLDAEKKKQTERPHVESLNKRFSMTHDKITMLEQMMCKISKGLFAHCYRCYRYGEIDQDIWISCIASLGMWILSYPSLFLQDLYLMYLGLALNDKSAGVRKASVHALKNLYEVDDNVPSLGRFTTRFSSQMIALVGDIHISVAISAIVLVKQLLRHQLLPPEIRHVIGALDCEHLIAQQFKSSQYGAKVDSKLTNALTGDINLTQNKLYQLSQNIYITVAGFMMAWQDMWQWITSVFLTIPEEMHTVELAARVVYQFVSSYGTVGSLVLGWDITSPHPQMFRVIACDSLMTNDSAMAIGSGQQYIDLRYLTDFYYGELAHAFRGTMFQLEQACLLDPLCGGIVRGWVLQRDQPPSCQYIRLFD